MSNNDYLWDGSGEPDPTVQQLERTLGQLRYKPSPLQIKAPNPKQTIVWRMLALAASVVVVGLGLWFILSSPEPGVPPGKSVQITTIAGAPLIENQVFAQQGSLLQGQWLETDASSTAKISLPEIGQVLVSPNSRIKLVELEKNEQRLELAQGKIEAKVNAPPRLFIIDTPSAKAVDLGCAYTLEVDKEGNSTLNVTWGYVAFETNERTSVVPAGARCHTRVKLGPGTPFFSDAPPSFQEALERIDVGKASKPDLQEIISLSQPKDTLTLWHLLPHVEASWRPDIMAAIKQFAPLPAGITEEEILRADKEALRIWRKDLIPFWK